MSSMMPPDLGAGPPPDSISVGGPPPGGPGLGGPPGGPPPGPDGPGPGDPDSGSVTGMLKQAMKLVLQAAELEGDDADTASIHDIAAKISKAIAAEQQLTDSAMGAGPGVKLVRKAAAGAGPQGGY